MQGTFAGAVGSLGPSMNAPLFEASSGSTKQVFSLLSCLSSSPFLEDKKGFSKFGKAKVEKEGGGKEVLVNVYVDESGITFVEKGSEGCSQGEGRCNQS